MEEMLIALEIDMKISYIDELFDCVNSIINIEDDCLQNSILVFYK